MKRLVLAVLLTFLLGACEGDHTAPSILQRFDQLRFQLRRITADSGLVAADMSSLDHRMQTGDASGIRSLSNRLRAHAQELAERAGRVGNLVRTLASAERDTNVRAYLRLTLRTLSWQYQEGRALMRVAQTTRADPLLLSTQDETLLSRNVDAARWYAWKSVLTARQAASLRQRFRRAFRYTPVRSAAAQVGPQGAA